MPTGRAVDVVAVKPEVPFSPGDVALRNRIVKMFGSRLDKIVDLTAASLYACEPSYRNPIAVGLQVEKSVDEGLKAFLMPREERVSTTGWPGWVGRSRAHQGVPLEAIHRAYHIAGQVVFGTFMEWAAEEELPRERYQALGDDLWYGVALHSDAAATAFRVAEDEMFGGRRADDLLDALLDGDADGDDIAGVALTWGWVVQARYAVVVQRPADWSAPPLTHAELPSRVAGVRVVWRVHGESAIGVVALGNASATAFADALPTRPGRRTGVSLVVRSLAELGRGRRLAELAARTVTAGGGVACLEERVPVALLETRPEVATELCTRVLAPLLALDRASRDLLLDTLAAWVAADGSVQRAATALFCHPNTVLERIRLLEGLTRRSLSVPGEFVELALALEALRMHDVRS